MHSGVKEEMVRPKERRMNHGLPEEGSMQGYSLKVNMPGWCSGMQK
jgi:hypothetical protein